MTPTRLEAWDRFAAAALGALLSREQWPVKDAAEVAADCATDLLALRDALWSHLEEEP